MMMDKSVNMNLSQSELKDLVQRIAVLENELKKMRKKLDWMKFRLANMAHDDKMVSFYTGFT